MQLLSPPLIAKTYIPCRPSFEGHGVSFCRGSPCILPEETLAGYEAAIDAGVDFVEMDAVRMHVHRSIEVAASRCESSNV